ncbi:MAG: tRNA dihydrouridine synthase DusB [Desulfuromonadales bacterium]|nr:tRNA dihydrouridine synthase DusB [Desulfuromonadales bacterium]
MKIGTLKLENPIISAPMAGISDLPYRLIMKRHGAALVFTEMISANGLFFNGKATHELLKSRPEEHPLGIQLFGEEPARLAEAVKQVEGCGELIDLNLGCPVRKVIRSGAGSALLREPSKVARIISSVRLVTSLPLTIKLRSGWDHDSVNFLEIARIAAEEGVDAVTLHPRTRTQMFGGQADWHQIKRLKESLSIPVIGSGDLFTAECIKTMFEQTGCDAVMIGRGGYGNPWIIGQALEMLADQPVTQPSLAERFAVARSHFELCLETFGPQKTLGQMRKHLCWYVRGMENAAGFRMEINRTKTIAEMNDRLEDFFADAA